MNLIMDKKNKNEPIKICCAKSNASRKLVTSKSSYTFDKTLVISVICSKSSVNNYKIFKGEENIAILEILGLIE